MSQELLPGPFIAGFESSTMRRRDGRRLDLVAATRHDQFADADYRRMLDVGIRTAREGTAWHRIEATPGRFDASSVIDRIRAAERHGIHVIWDLCHFGWPDDVDVFAPDFADRMARYAAWFARLLRNETATVPWFVPVNEPSFVAWAGGDVEYLNPFQRGRGDELKRQLVGASIAAAAAVRTVDPRARICHVDPLIHIVPDPQSAENAAESEARCRRHNAAQYAAWDMLGGRIHDELGGSDAELDVIGVNIYERNQWIDDGPILQPVDEDYRPVREMLAEVYERYRRPLIISETGREGDDGPEWLRYISDEVLAARASGVQVEAICLYPVTDYPGWDDDRHVSVGLWGYADDAGVRPPNVPLIEALGRETRRLTTDRADPSSSPALRRLEARAPAAGPDLPAIVLATDSRAPSGMGRQMLTLARGLRGDFEPIIAAPEAVDARWLLDAACGAGIQTWPLVDGSPVAQAASFRDRLAGADVALVNVHAGIGWEGHDLVAAARQHGGTTVLRTEHLPYLLTKPRDQAAYAAMVPCLDGLIAVSEGVARTYVAAGVPADLIDVVLNGVEDPADGRAEGDALGTQPSAIPGDLGDGGIEPDSRFLVSVGRLTDQKGYDVLLPAIRAVHEQHPDVRLLIVGSGPLAGPLRELADQLGLTRAVRFLRHVGDVPGLIARSAGVVLPSRFEGLPLVALEAMAVGAPVVATAVCGADEAVVDGFTGWLVPPEDPAALEAAILELLAGPAEAARRGREGRRRYDARFTANRMVDETVAVYRTFLDRWQRSGAIGARVSSALAGPALAGSSLAGSGLAESAPDGSSLAGSAPAGQRGG